ncbi:MAG: alpha/beta fold hydrolase, partial [Alphaproteobacteria bacterium]
LDLLDDLDLRDVTLVGFSVGAWLAMEMASKNNDRLKRLVLAGAVGAKFGGKYDRDIEDIYFHPVDRVRAMRFHDPALDPHVDMTELSKAEALAVARGREAITLICWDPYMHNPALKDRLNRQPA